MSVSQRLAYLSRVPLKQSLVPAVALLLAGSTITPFVRHIDTTAFGAQTIPLTVKVVEVQLQRQQVHIRLSNSGDKPILAWSIQLTLNSGKGEPVLTYRREDDGFLAADLRATTMIEPGDTKDVVETFPSGIDVASATAAVTAVVFEDATAIGEASRLDFIFHRRSTERDQLAKWVDVYKTALIKQRPHATLTTGRSLNSLSEPERRASTAEQMTRATDVQAQQAALEHLALTLDPEVTEFRVALSLRTSVRRLRQLRDQSFERGIKAFARVLDLQYANAVKHARRNQ